MMLWLNKGEEHNELFKLVTGARVTYELYQRLSTQQTVDAYQVLVSLSKPLLAPHLFIALNLRSVI
jgi:hypothetical protein